MSLSKAQHKQFNEDGFLVVNNVFTQDELDQINTACNESAEIQQHLNEKHSGFKFHLLSVTTKHSAFMSLAKSEKILALIRPLIGNDIQLQHSKLAFKSPGKGKGTVEWHQDFAYLPHTNTSLVSVMVCIDDMTPENGGMKMIRGSHKLGPLCHSGADGLESSCQEHQAWSNPNLIVDVMPKAGGISIHHCLTLHRSEDNMTNDLRKSIIFQYRADDAYQLADGLWDDTGILISGERKEIVRCEPLAIQLVKTKRYGLECPYGHAWNQDGLIAKRRNYFEK